MEGQESVNIFFVNLKFLHFGIYFKYFLCLFVAVLKYVISDFHI